MILRLVAIDGQVDIPTNPISIIYPRVNRLQGKNQQKTDEEEEEVMRTVFPLYRFSSMLVKHDISECFVATVWCIDVRLKTFVRTRARALALMHIR